jgi:ribosome assembly protein SQT1
MSSSEQHHQEEEPEDDILNPDDAEEEISGDEDHPMEEDEDDEELQFQNDSAAHFDTHTDSIFCVAQHPLLPSIVVTGGGDDTAYIFDTSLPDGPLLPSSYETNPQPKGERESLKATQKLDGHTDSVNAVAFTQPNGEYVVTAGLDGKLRAWWGDKTAKKWKFLAEAQEVQEINWVSSSPHPQHPNTIALGANDGSVWVYQLNAQDKESPLNILQAYYLHTESCTAGAWTPDGSLLGTVSEDGSFYVWDVFGTGQAVVSLTAEDQRFAVEGGLYSVALNQTIAAVGGAGGNIKIVGLPQVGAPEANTTSSKKTKAGASNSGKALSSSAGQILASLQAQSDSIETLSFSQPPLTLLAAGSVDGSIALFDTAHRFAVRRHIREAHEEFAVVKVEFVRNPQKGHLLTSAGMDGVVKRWDTRGGTTAAGQGFVAEWRGHRGEGEGGGVLGFVQGTGGERIVTAGDDSISLVFKADIAY